ncbi:DUF6186 family protein [Nocardia paucivorans]|uniref:DUF6186 family protein n=1 Tax=Nocardia paucivorans TaxID=114259 RepID=UPI0002F629A2|nr:DUF6186 family protein [Nocardia paucivorans]
MSERSLVIIGFAVILTAMIGAAVTTRLRRDRIAGLGEIVDHLMRRRAIRILAVLLWAWLGRHFLAR